MNVPKITILLDNGYHKNKIITALKKVYPSIMRKIRIQLLPKPTKKDKAEKGQSIFVPVVARWVIERSNAWVERCKILVKNYEKTPRACGHIFNYASSESPSDLLVLNCQTGSIEALSKIHCRLNS